MATMKTEPKPSRAAIRAEQPARKAKVAKKVAKRVVNKASIRGEALKKAAEPVNRVEVELNKNYSKAEKDRIIPQVLFIIESGASIHRACREVKGAPLPQTFQRWCREDPSLFERYTQSRLIGYLTFAEDIQEIADNPHQGITTVITTRSDGVEEKVTKEDMLGHRQLQVATRKWLLSKMLPKVFGDRLTVNENNSDSLNAALLAIAAKLPV